jgi:hypothetical protein
MRSRLPVWLAVLALLVTVAAGHELDMVLRKGSKTIASNMAGVAGVAGQKSVAQHTEMREVAVRVNLALGASAGDVVKILENLYKSQWSAEDIRRTLEVCAHTNTHTHARKT